MKVLLLRGIVLGVTSDKLEVVETNDEIRFFRGASATHMTKGEVLERTIVTTLCGQKAWIGAEVDDVYDGRFCRFCINKIVQEIKL